MVKEVAKCCSFCGKLQELCTNLYSGGVNFCDPNESPLYICAECILLLGELNAEAEEAHKHDKLTRELLAKGIYVGNVKETRIEKALFTKGIRIVSVDAIKIGSYRYSAHKMKSAIRLLKKLTVDVIVTSDGCINFVWSDGAMRFFPLKSMYPAHLTKVEIGKLG